MEMILKKYKSLVQQIILPQVLLSLPIQAVFWYVFAPLWKHPGGFMPLPNFIVIVLAAAAFGSLIRYAWYWQWSARMMNIASALSAALLIVSMSNPII
jgi:hypothetical protein